MPPHALDHAYLSVANTPLLTREGEVELARQMAKNRSALVHDLVASGLPLASDFENALLATRRGDLSLGELCDRVVGNPTTEVQEQMDKELAQLIANERAYERALGQGRAGDKRRQKRLSEIISFELSCTFWREAAGRVIARASELSDLTRTPRGFTKETGMNLGQFRALAQKLLIYRQRIDEAKAEMVQSNLRLVISFAKQHAHSNMQMADMIQEGNLGLLRAVDKFDYTKGYRFSTYASWWIRQSIQRGIANQSRVIRLPVHVGDSIRRVRRNTTVLTQTLGRTPLESEIAKASGLAPKKLKAIRDATLHTISVETPTSVEGDGRLGDLLSDDDAVSADEASAQAQRRSSARELLATLTAREQKVLRMRFGIGQKRIHSLQEVANDFALSRERVRQIESQALEKLRSIAPKDTELLARPTESSWIRKVS